MANDHDAPDRAERCNISMPASLLVMLDQAATEEHEDRSGMIRRCVVAYLRQTGRLPVPARAEVVS